MPSTQDKAENDKISHYRLNELLVEQAVSSIYLAQDEETENLVFLVTLQPDAMRSTDLADRFRRRAETVAQLAHNVIPPLLDFGVDGKRPYAVMAHRPGQFLAERLANNPKPDPQDKTKVIESLTLVRQLAGGLTISHPAGLIHHDLRPENIYLDETGNPYLLDLVVPPTSPATTQLEVEPATELDYQSPEQLAGKALSGRSNVYSLGILLYHLLAGRQPELPVSEWDIFEHKGSVREIPLNQVQSGLTAATYKAVQDSIWQKEWSRFETVEAQMKAIDQAITAESAPPPPPPPLWLKLFNQLRQPKTLKIVIPAIVLLFLLLLVLMFMRGRANRQRDITPTPDAAVLPVESETAVVTQPEDEPASQPTITITVTNEGTIDEVEVLPSAEEVDAPTVRPSPTETAVTETATEPAPTITASPTSETTSTPSPTNTATLEPTDIACIPSPPFGWVRYTIQANDSLSALSEATDTTVEQLMQVNCLDNILLSIGQTIWMPALEPTATATTAATSPSTSPTAVPPAPNPPGPNPTSPPPTPTVPAPPTP
ncbi:MAG: hypothetical protein CL608_13540 [Anaerolineaceae bacterium]|nr:hypothetical protein [Anaerolineaceae bacterium]